MSTTCWEKPGPRNPYPRLCVACLSGGAPYSTTHVPLTRPVSCAAPIPLSPEGDGLLRVSYDRTDHGVAQAIGRWLAGCRHERCVPAAKVRETHARHTSSLRLLLSVCGPVWGVSL
jgi:hypothetical protein